MFNWVLNTLLKWKLPIIGSYLVLDTYYGHPINAKEKPDIATEAQGHNLKHPFIGVDFSWLLLSAGHILESCTT